MALSGRWLKAKVFSTSRKMSAAFWKSSWRELEEKPDIFLTSEVTEPILDSTARALKDATVFRGTFSRLEFMLSSVDQTPSESDHPWSLELRTQQCSEMHFFTITLTSMTSSDIDKNKFISQMKDLGYNTHNAILNLGSLFILLIIYFIRNSLCRTKESKLSAQLKTGTLRDVWKNKHEGWIIVERR